MFYIPTRSKTTIMSTPNVERANNGISSKFNQTAMEVFGDD